MTTPIQPKAAFTWPPNPAAAAPPPAPPSPAPSRTSPLARLAAKLHPIAAAASHAARAAESHWLSPTALPLARRIADLNWSPDPADRFCDRCATTTGPGEGREFGCASCSQRTIPWQRAIRLGPFQDHLQHWIHELKFQRSWRLGIDLGRTLATTIRPLLPQALPGESPTPLVVIPIPSSFRRRYTRGIDHAQHIAQGLAAELNCPVAHALRRRHSPSQRSVTPSARIANVRGRILPNHRIDLAGAHILLIDDVMTTGATMSAAARALAGRARHALPHAQRPKIIWACVLAVTNPPDRAAPTPAEIPPGAE